MMRFSCTLRGVAKRDVKGLTGGLGQTSTIAFKYLYTVILH